MAQESALREAAPFGRNGALLRTSSLASPAGLDVELDDVLVGEDVVAVDAEAVQA